MKYMKRRLTVEAFQLGFDDPSPWWVEAEDNGVARRTADGGFEVDVGGGEMHLAQEGDWMVRGKDGDLFVVTPERFDSNYERIE